MTRQIIGSNNFAESVAVVPPVAHEFDNTPNDSDKTFTVPTNELWKLCHAHVILVTSATVGNRQLALSILDEDSNVIMDIAAGTVQAASTTRHYGFLQGIYRETSFVANELQVPLPEDCYLQPGWSVRFYDSAAISPAMDNMTVAFQYMKFSV